MHIRDARLFDARDARMYGATGHDLHVDRMLSNITIGYRNSGMIWDKIFPVVPVQKQSDGYYVWPREAWFKANNAERAPKTRANRVEYTVSSDNYNARNYALGIETSWEDLDNADEPLNIRAMNSNFIIDNLGLNAEIRMAAKVLAAAVGSTNTLANDYSNVSASTPIDDFDNAIESVRSTTGIVPNRVVMGPKVWLRLRKHPDLIDFIRGKGDNVGGGGVTLQQVAANWNLDQILIGTAIQNVADEGAPARYVDVWSNHIVFMHVAPNPGRMVPSFGYTFQYKPAGFPAPFVVRRYDEEPEMIEVQEVHHFQDEKIVASELGYTIIGG